MAKIIAGLYEQKALADRVVQELESSGFKRNQIHVTGQQGNQSDLSNTLQSAGIAADDAQYFAEGIRRGGVLVTVDSPDQTAGRASEIMDRYGPIDIDERGGQWRQSGWQSTGQRHDSTAARREDRFAEGSTRHIEDEGETTLPVTEEQLRMGKREVQTGGVRIRTYVTEQPVENTVNLRKENVNVERNRVDRPATDADMNAFREDTFDVTENSEEAVVSKEPRVVEEVKVRKDVEEQPKTVSDTVRRTKVETEDLGKQWSSGSERYQAFDSYEPKFRRHFLDTFGSQNTSFDEYRPAYRYGYDLAAEHRYQGRNWNDVEPDIQSEWEQQHPGSAWDKFKGAVQQGWESITNS